MTDKKKLSVASTTISSLLALRERFASFLGYSHSGNRNLYDSFGYPRIIMPEDYYAMYRRNDIANRLVKAFPQATWRHFPRVCDDSEEEVSEFEEEFEQFAKKWKLQRVLERADRVASVGRFGLLMLGFNDGLDPRRPLPSGSHKLLYMQPYGEYNIDVAQWDNNASSPRFGLPITYTLKTGQPMSEQQSPMRSITVHHSRVITFTETNDEDDLFGTPRLEAVYNRLKDLEKVVGGASEMFWQNGNRGMAYIAREGANLTDEEIESIQSQAEDFQHQLRRYLVGSGIDIQPLGSDVPDPGPHVDKLLDLIAGTLGIPKRILIGSERGELASGQDENNWSQRVEERRENYAAPVILQPLVSKLIETGNLAKPIGEFFIEFPDAGALGPQQEAEVSKLRTEALAAFVNAPGADMVVPINEFRESFLGLEPLEDEELAEIEELLAGVPDDGELEEVPSDDPDEEEANTPDSDVENPFQLLRAASKRKRLPGRPDAH